MQRSIPSPRETLLPLISPQQAAALPYSPNLLPGGRDVVTPYGTMRVYEWGPETGRKVILIHGDTSPAPVLGPIADALTRRGCRVLMFDTWGHGYSDTPLDASHDYRLYSTQVFYAVASSTLSWSRFSMIGFSLGGGLVVSFTRHFPYLVDSVILLAPAGILRSLPQGYESSVWHYHYLLPEFYVRRVLAGLLEVSSSPASLKQNVGNRKPESTDPVTADTIDLAGIVQWQFDHHKGFAHSFADTIRTGLAKHQHSDWRRFCNIIGGKKLATTPVEQSSKIFDGKVLLIFGKDDGVVVEKEIMEDLTEMMGGRENLVAKTVPGTHGFVVPSSEQVVAHISEFWELGG